MRRLALTAAVLVSAAGCGSAAQAPAIPQPNAVAVGFCQDMSVHHEQAVLMSQWAAARGTPAIRSIALSILTSQSEEVGAMRGWLKLWRRSPVDPRPMGWMMSMPMGDSSTPMPGMATSQQLVQLYQRTGKAFDVLFLQLMIRHHLAGIDMARYAIADHASAPVTDAARQMIADQVEDVGLMRALLTQDGGHELAPARM